MVLQFVAKTWNRLFRLISKDSDRVTHGELY